MSLNTERIKLKVKKAIAMMPTEINLMRKSKTDDGMGGYIEGNPDKIATFQAFLDDSHKSIWLNITKDSGTLNRTRSIKLLSVCESFQIRKDDYFEIDNIKYVVSYPGKIVESVYNSDIEVLQ